MNVSMIWYILGYVLKLQAGFLLLPCMAGLLYREKTVPIYFAVAVGCALIGELISHKKPENQVFYLKEGCVATALSWILFSLSGGLPLYLTGEIPGFVDMLFEAVSGYTTTGSSILSDVEVLSRSSLLWRSFFNWIGGMGVLVFLMAVLPMSGGSNLNLMKAESPGPSVGKLVPKMRHTARILYFIYIGMTVVLLLFLLLGGMSFFEALATAFSTAGTGGFGIKNDSIAGFSPYIQWVTAIFMLLFGVNFNAYYWIIFGKIKKIFEMDEVKWYLAIVASSVLLIFVDLKGIYATASEALTHAFFQVASIISTTGFATADFNLWSSSSKTVLMILLFTGACAGSTAGGLKISRIVAAFKIMFKELASYINPKSIVTKNMDGKPMEYEIVRSISVYFVTYLLLFTLSVFAVSFEGKDMATNFTAVATCFNNVGPGLELVGPTQNFGHFNHFTKIILIFDMLAGRLELFPLLILFHPAIWKDALRKKRECS